MLRLLLLVLVSAGWAASAAAQVPDTRSARAMTFPVRGYQIAVSGELSETDARTVAAIVPLMAERLRQPVRYYASIAWSPDEGLASEALQMAMAHHTVPAADAAALAACNAARAGGTQACRIAARIVPKGYEARPLTLSVDATRLLEGAYRRKRGPKALAISPATGAFATGGSDGEALAACAATARRPTDCRIAVRN